MNRKAKTLGVPYQEAFDGMTLAHLSTQIEECGAVAALDSVNWPQEFPYVPITKFYVARSSSMLFIKYVVKGSMLKAIYSNDMDPVWQDSCVEFFCQLPGAERYVNFEFNCIGTCLASSRKSRDEGIVPFSPEQFGQIVRFPSLGRRAFCEMEGHFEWELTVGIPFELMGFTADKLPETLRANFYKCADDTSLPHYVSWSPIELPKPNFHCPEFFGTLTF